MDTDSEADSCANINEELQNPGDESSEEEWTYTAARQNEHQGLEKRNVVIRLDFDEVAIEQRPPQQQQQRVASNGNNGFKGNEEMGEERNIIEQQILENREESRENDSDDEMRHDKTKIQKLIKEVEKLVRDGNQHGANKTFPTLILNDKDLANNHRTKFARIKEWLKLNSTRNYDIKSTSQVFIFFVILVTLTIITWDLTNLSVSRCLCYAFKFPLYAFCNINLFFKNNLR